MSTLDDLRDRGRPLYVPEAMSLILMDVGTVRLDLLKAAGREVICDQHGRPLEGVVGFSYEAGLDDEDHLLTVKVQVPKTGWDLGMGRPQVTPADTEK